MKRTLISLKKSTAKYLLTSVMFLPISFISNASETNATLVVTPKSCVALHKGQKCYLEVTFDWQAKLNDYCLVNNTRSQVMKCWSDKNSGQYSFDFQSTQSNDFSLQLQDSNTDVAHAQIVVAWVYKSKKRSKSSWRLF
ncbi:MULTISPECIES: DUF3019 domain-containing protein [unclassified Pseudoalteromonas]|uniref:DUF3019 domain-containing protein n=1 Tax=unclassified Pseudoalteromonas TaxID=194690 RepID=UPI000694048A|nr:MULTISPECIES: DUF3019 domain-containing protein [unclassified Pseudoalteromonas]